MEGANSLQPSLKSEYLEKLYNIYHKQMNNEALDYLRERGINEETVKKFSIGFEKDVIGFKSYNNEFSGYFHNRVIFPLVSIEEKTVDLIGRTIDDKEPKYKSLIGVDDVFFNEQVLNAAEDVILCNSIFDVLSLDQAKLPSICMVSNHLSNQQIEKLMEKRVFLAFGNDEIGRRETIRVSKLIQNKVRELYILHLPEGLKDINDFFMRIKNPVQEFINLINLTLKKNMQSMITPDSHYLIHFQEEYLKRNKGLNNGVKTGFDELDTLLVGGLQEGLYLLGGHVSVGKTTFLKQLADQLAEQIPVIFVSWDMTSFELWVRSISRITDFSTQEILTGQAPIEEVQKANQQYSTLAGNIWTLDANIDTALEDIVAYISKISQSLNKKPAIILDHLRRIHLKNNPGESQLQIVYHLQSWSRQWSIPIVLATTGTEDKISCDLLAAVDVYMSLEGDAEKPDLPVKLNIKKNRNGTSGEVKLLFERKSGRFSKI